MAISPLLLATMPTSTADDIAWTAPDAFALRVRTVRCRRLPAGPRTWGKWYEWPAIKSRRHACRPCVPLIGLDVDHHIVRIQLDRHGHPFLNTESLSPPGCPPPNRSKPPGVEMWISRQKGSA